MIWAEAARRISLILREEFPSEYALISAWRILADMSGERLDEILPWKSQALLPVEHMRSVEIIIERLKGGEPIEYIQGNASFHSLELSVDNTALIPRPETEILVESVIRVCAENDVHPRSVLDLGTGSGCIAFALAKALPVVHIIGIDRSLAVLFLAARNASKLNMMNRCSFAVSDWWRGLDHRYTFDVVISNPPYIRHNDMVSLPRSVKDFEPMIALDGGIDGLSGFREIIAGAVHGLRPRGILALECGYDQADEVLEIIEKTDAFTNDTVVNDLNGIPRIIHAQRKENHNAP